MLPEWLRNRREFTEGYMHFNSTELIDMASTCERSSNLRTKYEKKVLLDWVTKIPDLCWVSQYRLKEMCDRLLSVRFCKGDCLMAKGTEGDCMYLLLDGIVGVYLDDMILAATVKPNNAIGENSLRTSGIRTATLIAHTDVVALKLKKIDYENIVLREMLQERRDTYKVLKGAGFFSQLPHDKLMWLSSKVFVKVFEAGTQIYGIGDPAMCMYIVKLGCVKLEAHVKIERVLKWPSGTRTWELKKSFKYHKSVMKTCGAGEVFGEKELLRNKERNHSAETTEQTVMIVINKENLGENLTLAEQHSLGEFNEEKPDTPHIVQTITSKFKLAKMKERSLMDGLNYNPCPVGRDFDTLKGIKLMRLNKLCKKQMV